MPVIPISIREFLELLQKCRPPSGWSRRVAVANSGGPDSMCLLWLLAASIKHSGHLGGLPERLYSIHVNHGLQALNSTMAERVSAATQNQGVIDLQYKIPWGTSPYPELPSPGQAFEETARNARSQTILNAVCEHEIHSIAYGHHADDQVETAIMRLSRGSSEQGAAGMRRIRRFGMEEGLGPITDRGMSRFIVRPFLAVSKDRILATCDANQIQYVTDPTNFQPEATFRNAIRNHLSLPERTNTTQKSDIVPAILKLRALSQTDDLREAVRKIGQKRDMLDCQANTVIASFISEQTKLGPNVGAFLLPSAPLQSVSDPDLRTTMVRTLMRFVSPQPWGSIAAVAYGRHGLLQKIVTSLWGSDEGQMPISGGKVLFTPVVIRRDRTWCLRRNVTEGETTGWLIQREPASRADRIKLNIRFTPSSSSGAARILWDNRFIITFDLTELDKAGVHLKSGDMIRISPSTNLVLPKVVLERDGEQKAILAEFRNTRKAGWTLQAVQGLGVSYIRPLESDM